MSDGATAARILGVGETSLLLELPDARTTLAVYETLRLDVERGRMHGIVDVVPAARTVLVTSDPSQTRLAAVVDWMQGAAVVAERHSGRAESAVAQGASVEIPVRYDGTDLDEVAELVGTDREGLIALHLESEWRAAFVGFAPGFAYLVGDPRLSVPRRPAPRAAVPAGSVALAAGYCGVYPRESPGGWQLIGTTTRELWNAGWAQPALLAPGTRVRFVRAD